MGKEPVTQIDRQIVQGKILLLLLLFLFVAVAIKSAWLSDDVFITLRTVRNFHEGYGLVWNIHERVQAYTHPLWMLLLSLTYFVTTETFYSTLFVSILLSTIAVAFAALKIAKNLTGGLLALLLLTLSKAFIDYSTSGLENPLTYLLLTLFFLVFIQHKATIRTLFWLTFVAALGLLNRMDSALFFAPALLYTLYLVRSMRALFVISLGSIPFWLWIAFSIIYYGFPFPNTAYAKLGVQIGAMELSTQGLHYLLNSLSIDPITLITICLAFVYSTQTKDRRLILIMLGVTLYIAYVVRIGGSFMSGRYLSVPYLGAVLVLTQNQYLSLKHIQTHLLIFALLLIGLLNPPQSPLLSNAKYEWTAIDSNGIADERGHYYQRYGLMSADRQNRIVEQGIVQGTERPADFTHCGIGYRGFVASPYTRLVDFCGLADAFIARLPTVYAPDWRVGHPIRQIPPGYIGTLRTGVNQIHDPKLALLYDRLTHITQGSLWTAQRFLEIWRFNTGTYHHLLDSEMLRFPDIVELGMGDRSDEQGTKKEETREAESNRSLIIGELFFADDFQIDVHAQGIRFNLGAVRHPTHLDIGFNSDYFDVVYFLNGLEIGYQTVAQSSLSLGDRRYTVVQVEPQFVEQGFDTIRISPRVESDYLFAYISLVDLNLLNQNASHDLLSPLELREVLQLYYHTFYHYSFDHSDRAERQRLLKQLLSRAQQGKPEHWAELPQLILFDLLAMPAPKMHEIVIPHLQTNFLLVDSNGHPQIRYIGSAESETLELGEQTVLKLHLYFLVEEPVEKRYSLWFGIKRRRDVSDTDNLEQNEYDQWMVYDHFPEVPTIKWGQGTLVHLEPKLTLAPGIYEITFGFWTPNDRERLTIEQPDVYWIHLGEQIVKSMP
ncbi:hypothetical protein KFU94_27300 [Chloroflexi bacterium TSY]|nr:hypothetical protein [Chloroflexi bacterium TSY]